MAVEGLTYTQYCQSITNPKALETMLNLENAVNSGQISQYEFAQTVEAFTGKTAKPYYSKFGNVLGYTLEEPITVSTPNPINSNASTVSRGTLARPIASTTSDGKAVIQGLRGIGSKVATGAGLIGIAAAAVGTGCQLGLNIDKALYNANPDIFGNTPIGSLDTSTFEKIIIDSAASGDVGGQLLQAIFAIDPNTNASQMYIDENAYAYMAAYLQSIGAFDMATQLKDTTINGTSYPMPIYCLDLECNVQSEDFQGRIGYYNPTPLYTAGGYTYYAASSTQGEVIHVVAIPHGDRYSVIRIMDATDKASNIYPYYVGQLRPDFGNKIYVISAGGSLDRWAYQNKTFSSAATSTYIPAEQIHIPIYTGINFSNNTDRRQLSWLVCFGEKEISLPYDGMSQQEGISLPQNLTGNPTTDLDLLKQQYPQLWNNAIQYPVIQPDGNVQNYTYVPIPMPENYPRGGTQPTTGNASQTNTEIQPDTATNTLIEYLTKVLTNPFPQTEEQLTNDKPPENPIDTGEGSSPTAPLPVGSASALWAIYHPTQGQIDAFGAWLWSSNFIDQIQKIFNNPMESIIGLHKVYATPIDAGVSTIGVGYLDSGVSSAYITQQYVNVNCGSVDLLEQFGNVFDYAPFTTVKLYLPFVGIVNLDVSEVMRSAISINYGVDVLTGACLAKVNISRDGNDSILYQFAGNCAVQYPLSMGSYMGIVSSIIGVAGSIAATVASGGNVAPLALGAAGAAFGAHTSVQNSGNFSGNAGAMGGKIPYLIIERPQTRLARNQESFEGVPTNEYKRLGDYDGFVQCTDYHITDVNATDSELREIAEYLRNGVIV